MRIEIDIEIKILQKYITTRLCKIAAIDTTSGNVNIVLLQKMEK